MKKYLRKAAAVFSAVMIFSSVLDSVSMARVDTPPNMTVAEKLQPAAKKRGTTATPSNAETASPSNAGTATASNALKAAIYPELTFVEDCAVDYTVFSTEGYVSNVQFTFTRSEDDKYRYTAYLDLTGPDGFKKEHVATYHFDGTDRVHSIDFSTELLNVGRYEISARIAREPHFDTVIGHSTNTLSFNIGSELEISNIPIKSLEGKESASEDYELYPAVVFMFGTSDSDDSLETVKNLNSLLGSYNLGDVKAFFFDCGGEPEETKALAASSKNIGFCNQKSSGIDYNEYGQKIAAEYGLTWTNAPGVFLFSHGNWTGGSCGGKWSSEKFTQAFNDLGIRKTETKKTAIKDFYSDHKFNLSGSPSWTEQPSWRSPYRAGKLSEATVLDGLNALNFVRFIADIPADITSNEEYEKMTQAGMVILQKLGTLTHYPKQPADMPDEFFELGYKGTSSSNIAGAANWSSKSLSWEIIYGWMEDGDSSNIDRVGHRRWCLNPAMTQTGFGVAGGFSGMYSIDGSGENAPEDIPYVAWPGKVMPYEYFKGPWSVSVDSNRYTIDEERAAVTLTSGSKTYRLSSRENNGYFHVDKGGYGMGDTIIFKPSSSFGSGAAVTVTVEGVVDREGNQKELVYTVNFFKMSGSTGGGGGGGSSSGDGGGGGSSSGGGGGGSSSGGGGGGSLSGGPGQKKDTSQQLNTGLVTTGETVTAGTWQQQADQTWRLLDSLGNPVTSRWAFLEGRYYLLGSDSIMKTGWQLVNSVWYYMNPDGSMAVGWQSLNNEWYYLKPDGAMAVGWIFVNGKEYYLDTNGKMLAGCRTPDGFQVNNLGEKI